MCLSYPVYGHCHFLFPVPTLASSQGEPVKTCAGPSRDTGQEEEVLPWEAWEPLIDYLKANQTELPKTSDCFMILYRSHCLYVILPLIHVRKKYNCMFSF